MRCRLFPPMTWRPRLASNVRPKHWHWCTGLVAVHRSRPLRCAGPNRSTGGTSLEQVPRTDQESVVAFQDAGWQLLKRAVKPVGQKMMVDHAQDIPKLDGKQERTKTRAGHDLLMFLNVPILRSLCVVCICKTLPHLPLWAPG